ncbi:hypothetical protein CYMTET_24968 [Cymbomonas tetramitiformis]|uniref:Uncharacterized protein n=1 Tax=Cymbomonas tetramitiformis TaxID=36881 RepID=A0AAE0FUR3_9CHLO|nr:hypothetical protein CYMTET_24968 [Cymbomonas tetramitiformis]
MEGHLLGDALRPVPPTGQGLSSEPVLHPEVRLLRTPREAARGSRRFVGGGEGGRLALEVEDHGAQVGECGVGLARGVLVPVREVSAMKPRGGSHAGVAARLDIIYAA